MADKEPQEAPRAAPTNDPERVSRALAEAQREAQAHPRDETIPGGRYLVDGEWVDADGKPLKKDKP